MPGEHLLEVKMLGNFSLSYAGKEIVIDRNTASKTTQLLQLLLLHAKEGVSKAGLIDALYNRSEVENKNGSLNNTIYRLKRQLRTAGLPECAYISIQGGLCTWTEKIPVRVDAVEFERLVKKGQRLSGEERVAAYLEAVRGYTGEFLPGMIGEDWVAVTNVYYRDLYCDCMTELCESLMAAERFEDVAQLAKNAADIYPFEDWQLWQIDALMAMSYYHEALEIYEKTTQKTFTELGLAPSPEMMKRFRVMAEHVTQTAEVTVDIKSRLSEKERADGAYYCTFPSFVDIYHVFSRMMERNGISVYIMLCTLKNSGVKAAGEDERDQAASKLLAENIRKSLRRGDFYTRYSYTQYLIMFAEISQENCRIVSERIQKNFLQCARKEYDVEFSVASIADICGEGYSDRHFPDSGELWKNGKPQGNPDE